MAHQIDERFKRISFLGVEGPIGAGKSEFVKKLQELISNGLASEFIATDQKYAIFCMQEPVEDFREILTDFATDPYKKSYLLQTTVLNKRTIAIEKIINEALAYVSQDKKRKVIVIIERTFLGDKLFANVAKKCGFMTESEYDYYDEIWDTFRRLLGVKISHYVYIRPDFKVCMERIKKRNRDFEQGLAEEYLKQVYDEHDTALCFNGETDILTKSVNGTDMHVYTYTNPDGTDDEQMKNVMNILEKILNEFEL